MQKTATESRSELCFCEEFRPLRNESRWQSTGTVLVDKLAYDMINRGIDISDRGSARQISVHPGFAVDPGFAAP